MRDDDVATLIYTSGTTGAPKGVETTHAALLFQVHGIADILGIEFGDTITSFMPTAHIADRLTALYVQEVLGTQVTSVGDPKQIAAALADLHPTIWGAVPRVWEKLKAAIEFKVAAEPDETRRQGMAWAMSVAAARSAHQLADEPVPAELGAVGKLLPGMESRLSDDGELHVRGPLVMKGYRGLPEQTAEAIDAEGWLHTGDIVSIDDAGYLRVVDRKKEMIINAAGKNMSPTNIENAVKAATPLIGAMAVLGDGRSYNTALIVLDAESVEPYAREHALPDASAAALAVDATVLAAIEAGVAVGNSKLSRVEQVKRFRVLPTFWEAGGDEVTLTLKLKRKVIAEKYTAQIDELYAENPPAEIVNVG